MNKPYDLELSDLTIFSACFFFQKADDRLALSNAKSGMFEQRKISLKEAPLIFNLWDNVYHQNGVKNLETNGRWDPSKLAKGMSMSIYLSKFYHDFNQIHPDSKIRQSTI